MHATATAAAAVHDPSRTSVLLASDRRAGPWDAGAVAATDRVRRGAVALRLGAGAVVRAEPGPAGPLTLEVRVAGGDHLLRVWGPSGTPPEVAAAALDHAAAWAGHGDDPTPLDRSARAHPVVAGLWRRLGSPRLSRLPRVGEAVGRAVLGQLVQGAEAARSTAQVAALAGTPSSAALWHWPTARQIGAVPAWALRRCGVSLRGARALHAAAVEDARLERARENWEHLEARLRALPGVGAWTSGEARRALGDPDAVPVGDYNLPQLVGSVLTGEQRARAEWTDEEMLALLAPFAGQRGRLIRLVERAVAARLVRYPARRAPRAALSAHRYW